MLCSRFGFYSIITKSQNGPLCPSLLYFTYHLNIFYHLLLKFTKLCRRVRPFRLSLFRPSAAAATVCGRHATTPLLASIHLSFSLHTLYMFASLSHSLADDFQKPHQKIVRDRYKGILDGDDKFYVMVGD